MAWIEVHQSLWDHRKTIAVADALDLPEIYAGAHLIALWTWAIDNAPEGVLETSPRILARGAKWTGDPDAFLDALLTAGFLEYSVTGDLVIHDWDDYAGKLVDRRKANAERMRKARAEHKQSTSEPRAAHVQRTSRARVELQNSTQPNTTEPGDTPPNPPRGADAPAVVKSPPAESKPRTPRQQASDAAFNRRRELYVAWCRGLDLDPEADAAAVGQGRAYNQLKPVLGSETPTPAEFEACTRFLNSQSWRSQPPSCAEVVNNFTQWVAAGRPERETPKPRNVQFIGPPGNRPRTTAERLAEKALRLEAQGQ